MKKLICLFLSCCIIFSSIITTDAVNASKHFAKNGLMREIIPNDACLYVKSIYKELFNAYLKESDDVDQKLDEAIIGDAFIIYETKQMFQTANYYFTIQSNNKIQAIICAMDTTDGWRISIDNDYVQYLNDINFINNSDRLIIVNDNDKLNTIDMHDFIYDKNHKLIKFDIEEALIKDCLVADKENYVRAFSTNTSTAKVCSLYNQKGQGNYGMCWAAALATIVNYLDGTNISPFTICNDTGIGYDDGAGIEFVQSSFARYHTPAYGFITYTPLSYSTIKTNLNQKYPLYLACVNTNDSSKWHAVTAYGYTKVGSYDYMYIWNSGLNSGTGGLQLVMYNSTSTIFSYANSSYRWRYTLSSL